MEKSEQLRKEYTYWAEKYMDANKRLTDLLPSGDTAAFIPTEEYVANYKKADRDIRNSASIKFPGGKDVIKISLTHYEQMYWFKINFTILMNFIQ